MEDKEKLIRSFNHVRAHFHYKKDSHRFFDFWKVMRFKDGKFTGDCEDFSLTVMWYFYDQNFFKFFLNVLILHRSFIWHVKTHTGGGHAVGYCGGMYFDNWVFEPQATRALITEKVGHRFKYPIIFPTTWLFMLAGLFAR